MKINPAVYIMIAIAACCFFYSAHHDKEFVEHINVERNKTIEPMQTLITDSAPFISFGLVVIFLIIFFISKDKLKFDRFWQLLLCLLLTTIVVQLLKYGINRPRPYEIIPEVQKLTDGGGGSFPSGHTADAFTVLAFFSLKNSSKYIQCILFIWGLLVAYSRVYLGVHYVSDVCAAMVIGMCCSLAGTQIIYFIKNKRKSVT
jgi:undecaprenyl-diphosphatase